MTGYLGKDANGLWCAFLTVESALRPGGSATGTVRMRHVLPVSPNASRETAEAAFKRYMERESRKRHGR